MLSKKRYELEAILDQLIEGAECFNFRKPDSWSYHYQELMQKIYSREKSLNFYKVQFALHDLQAFSKFSHNLKKLEEISIF